MSKGEDNVMNVKQALLILVLSILCCLPQASGEETITVDKGFNGWEIKVGCGGMIRVELEQAGATGYTWEILNFDKKHFELVSVKTPEPHEKTGLVGASMKKVWLIRAKETGKSELKFNLFRPWEGKDKAADSFLLKVHVD